MDFETVTYGIGCFEYELYRAASGDFCVIVSCSFMDPETYNLGSKESALKFILEDVLARSEEKRCGTPEEILESILCQHVLEDDDVEA